VLLAANLVLYVSEYLKFYFFLGMVQSFLDLSLQFINFVDTEIVIIYSHSIKLKPTSPFDGYKSENAAHRYKHRVTRNIELKLR
jgi:hypothetical protein